LKTDTWGCGIGRRNPRQFQTTEVIMKMLFGLRSFRLLTLGGAKACTMGPIAGDQLEDEVFPYNGG
jgi:hypothetical protein